MDTMEFLLAAFVGLMLLGLASLLVVEGSLVIFRTYSRVSYWFRYRYPSWHSGRQVRALKNRYGRRDRSRPSLGRLRFSRTRAVQLEELSSGQPEVHLQDNEVTSPSGERIRIWLPKE